MVTKENVKEGDWFILSKDAGYSDSQRKEVFQVMECWGNVMVVSVGEDACMTKPYEDFDKVDINDPSVRGLTKHYSDYFEDNRK